LQILLFRGQLQLHLWLFAGILKKWFDLINLVNVIFGFYEISFTLFENFIALLIIYRFLGLIFLFSLFYIFQSSFWALVKMFPSKLSSNLMTTKTKTFKMFTWISAEFISLRKWINDLLTFLSMRQNTSFSNSLLTMDAFLFFHIFIYHWWCKIFLLYHILDKNLFKKKVKLSKLKSYKLIKIREDLSIFRIFVAFFPQ